MLLPDILLEIHHARRQELLREREHDQLVAQARQSTPDQWRLRLARGLHGIAARIECPAEHSVTGLRLRTDTRDQRA